MTSEDILTTLNNVFQVLVFFGFYDICSSSDKSRKVLKETLASYAKVLSNWHNRQVLAICICHFSTCVCAACVSSCFVFQCFCVCACLPLQRCNAKKDVFVKKGSNLVLQGLLPGFTCFVVYKKKSRYMCGWQWMLWLSVYAWDWEICNWVVKEGAIWKIFHGDQSAHAHCRGKSNLVPRLRIFNFPAS